MQRTSRDATFEITWESGGCSLLRPGGEWGGGQAALSLSALGTTAGAERDLWALICPCGRPSSEPRVPERGWLGRPGHGRGGERGLARSTAFPLAPSRGAMGTERRPSAGEPGLERLPVCRRGRHVVGSTQRTQSHQPEATRLREDSSGPRSRGCRKYPSVSVEFGPSSAPSVRAGRDPSFGCARAAWPAEERPEPTGSGVFWRRPGGALGLGRAGGPGTPAGSAVPKSGTATLVVWPPPSQAPSQAPSPPRIWVQFLGRAVAPPAWPGRRVLGVTSASDAQSQCVQGPGGRGQGHARLASLGVSCYHLTCLCVTGR
ncbi:bcl-2-binding component 3, isoforms 3/4-like [Leopardus geoffroyi]|uniref:bcl-2-binding component 3, isoforms 3/4-like n=1 Tax=Leopardus geoffroyi TaxID=46844 RepID=UPI001E265A23|nr:bcl-2-binding component 3, isoforms 3/4-like [Leopardus geoffroyi]XP_045303818.1 bcl-2-binding component 3, isoforms 3/4-like [Leopardus geoffroyi]